MLKSVELTTSCVRTILFADTDAGGMMYFGQVGRFVETGIHDWFKQNGISFLNKDEADFFWVIRELNVAYSKMIPFNEELKITTRLNHVGRYSIHFSIDFYGNHTDPSVSATAKLVPINLKSGNCVPLPEPLFALRKVLSMDLL